MQKFYGVCQQPRVFECRCGVWGLGSLCIVYYGFVQNVIFNALKNAVFALGFGYDDDEKEEAKSKK